MGDVLHTVVGVTQIVIEVGTLTTFQQLFVNMSSLLVLLLLIGTVGLSLGDSMRGLR